MIKDKRRNCKVDDTDRLCFLKLAIIVQSLNPDIQMTLNYCRLIPNAVLSSLRCKFKSIAYFSV